MKRPASVLLRDNLKQALGLFAIKGFRTTEFGFALGVRDVDRGGLCLGGGVNGTTRAKMLVAFAHMFVGESGGLAQHVVDAFVQTVHVA